MTPEIILEEGDIEVVHQVLADSPKSVGIRRPKEISRIKLLNEKRKEFRAALMKLERKGKEDFAYDFAVTALAILESLTKEDGEEEVMTLSILADLLVQKRLQFNEEYDPFKEACRFVKDLAESDREVSIKHYLAATT